jgi:hypothetical protein
MHESVEKERYTREVLRKYGVVYAPSLIWANKVSGKSFRWPQDEVLGISPQKNWMKRKNLNPRTTKLQLFWSDSKGLK